MADHGTIYVQIAFVFESACTASSNKNAKLRATGEGNKEENTVYHNPE